MDVVIEHIGPEVWDQCIAALCKGGRLVTCGATTGPEVKLDIRALFVRQLTIKGSYVGTRAELVRAAALLESGKLRPVVDRVRELAECAHHDVRLPAARDEVEDRVRNIAVRHVTQALDRPLGYERVDRRFQAAEGPIFRELTLQLRALAFDESGCDAEPRRQERAHARHGWQRLGRQSPAEPARYVDRWKLEKRPGGARLWKSLVQRGDRPA